MNKKTNLHGYEFQIVFVFVDFISKVVSNLLQEIWKHSDCCVSCTNQFIG